MSADHGEGVAYASERDFVARFLLPGLQAAAARVAPEGEIELRFEPITRGGPPDLTVRRTGRPLLVVEAKFKKRVGTTERDIEPRDPAVIAQAVRYAGMGGFPYYLTCNAKRLVLFQSRPGFTPYESEVLSLDYEQRPDWAEETLLVTTGRRAAALKAPDETLIDLFREASMDLFPEVRASLGVHLKDSRFRERYDSWLAAQGLRPEDSVNSQVAQQATYLQVNKTLFYQVLRAIYPDDLEKLVVSEEDDLSEALGRYYSKVRDIDYLPVYQTDILSEVPLSHKATVRFRTLLDTLNEFDFSRIRSDFIGRLYEKIIPTDERKRLGQFYTPPEIVDVISRMTITSGDSLVLDPACGSGGFLVRVYHLLGELSDGVSAGDPEQTHQALLSRVYGIDINQFAAHLSVINLAVQNPRAKVDRVNVVVRDTFDTRPGTATLTGFEGVTTSGNKIEIRFPTRFDAVVGNPPYIRQELLGRKEKEKIARAIETDYRKTVSIGSGVRGKEQIVLNRQSDIYVYFFVHGLRYLREGGRLGFISSNKYLEVSYGEPFQEFLLKRALVRCIIEFDRAIFPDADINTCITILEKADPTVSPDHLVRFVRVKKPLAAADLVERIETAAVDTDGPELRVTIVPQRSLAVGKWNTHLRAPPVFRRVVASLRVRPLKELADVFFGIKTGYNPFFVLSKDEAAEWKIEEEYLAPVVTSPKNIRGLVINRHDVRELLLLCNIPKNKLLGTRVLGYIQHGERLRVVVDRTDRPAFVPLPKVPSIAGRDPWYGLAPFEIPAMIIQELYDTEVRVLWNKAGAHARAPLYYCNPKDKKTGKVIAGYLNSSVSQMLFELYGRSYGGGVLDIKVYEVQSLPTIDPASLSVHECVAISGAFDHLAEVIEKGAPAKEVEGARARLDETVTQALGLSPQDASLIREAVSELREIRKVRRSR